MCYTVDNKNSKKVLSDKLKRPFKSDQEALEATFLSGFAHPKMCMVKQEQPDVIDIARWGLVPGFISDASKAKEYFINTLNAKAETIFEKVSFKNSIMPRRCIVPISGFYEWRDINKVKYPYYIKAKDQDIACVGGIYDYWVEKATGEVHTTFSMITTEANPLMSKIHNLKLRQPLLLSQEDSEQWLDNSLKKEDVIRLMKPLSEEFMTAHTVKKISPKTADVFSDEIKTEFEYPELALYDS
jgi:putative SOS response-associated peptidase YedK